MAASKENIRQWLLRGLVQKDTHVIIVCEAFELSDYPVYVGKNDDVEEVEASISDTIMEIYDLDLDIEMQLSEDRAFHR